MDFSTNKASPKHWQLLDETLHSKCKIFDVYKRRCQHPTRALEGDFFVIKSPDWVQVLALTPESNLILVRQYRFGSENLSLEVPAGLIDPKESPIDAAQRELLEETGFVGSSARVIGVSRPNPAFQNNHVHFVLIEGCTQKSEQSWDPHEEIETIQAPVKDVLKSVNKGLIDHALTLTALFHLNNSLSVGDIS